ncbi:hypothetical protein [Devosia sp.]|uniref:hypothetical protein n=1 Tax=Devosia sp. TaxID=1871048 RepID=UPI002FC8EA81
MAWEILAIWAIVILTITWFVRDEKRLNAELAVARAARYYAHAPKYRHASVKATDGAAPTPPRRTGGLTETQRAFLKAWKR